MKNWGIINRILLGLLMLVPGLLKLFVVGPTGVSGMMSGISIFAWAPFFWAWLLILAEIISGAAILANYAAGKVVSKFGTATLTREELIGTMQNI